MCETVVRAPPQIGTSTPRSDNDTAAVAAAVAADRPRTQAAAGRCQISCGVEEFRKAQSGRPTDNYPLRRRTTKEGFFRWFCCCCCSSGGGGRREKSSLPLPPPPTPILFVPANSHLRNEGEQQQEEGGEEETRKRGGNRHACFLSSALPLLEISRTSHISYSIQPSFKFVGVVVANFCPPHQLSHSAPVRSGRGKNTKGHERRVEDEKPRERRKK